MVDFDGSYEMPSSCVGYGCHGEILMIDSENSCKMTFGVTVFHTPVLLIVFA
jgi:hypothetical protein